jgi:hypothetical protein
MKQIRTKKYIRTAQTGGYPPGVTGNENYFKDTTNNSNKVEVFEIERNWDTYGEWYNTPEPTPIPMPQNGISTIYVKAGYTIDSNVGLGDTPNVSINNIISITDSTNKDVSQFELTDVETDEIKNTIIENDNSNENNSPDTTDEFEGLR